MFPVRMVIPLSGENCLLFIGKYYIYLSTPLPSQPLVVAHNKNVPFFYVFRYSNCYVLNQERKLKLPVICEYGGWTGTSKEYFPRGTGLWIFCFVFKISNYHMSKKEKGTLFNLTPPPTTTKKILTDLYRGGGVLDKAIDSWVHCRFIGLGYLDCWPFSFTSDTFRRNKPVKKYQWTLLDVTSRDKNISGHF